MTVQLSPHKPSWAAMFDAEQARLTPAFGPALTVLHHIGSTAIPAILAKPIIDMLGVATTLAAVDTQNSALEGLGYEVMGEYGIAGRRYFRKFDADGIRTHHLHVFAQGSPHIARHLAFRDYLRTHPEVAADYSALKARLVAEAADSEAYMDGKDPFIQRVEAQALAWAGAT